MRYLSNHRIVLEQITYRAQEGNSTFSAANVNK
jgi:hypothetical protein